MQFDGSKPVFLPKHTVPRRKEIKFLRRAQTQIPNKRITSVCAVILPELAAGAMIASYKPTYRYLPIRMSQSVITSEQGTAFCVVGDDRKQTTYAFVSRRVADNTSRIVESAPY
jgi:hypothetical protein